MKLSTIELQGNIIVKKGVRLEGDIHVATRSGGYPFYQGPYEVTPTQETQILYTKDKATTDNIVVNPIPEYYGLITYNGSGIKVS